MNPMNPMNPMTLNQNKTKSITTHIHGRIAKLAESAIQQNLCVECDRIPPPNDHLYKIRTISDQEAIEVSAITAGTILLKLLGRIPQ